MSPEIAIQIAIRARLAETPAVTDLVSAAHILDRNARPNPDPSIIIGEDQITEDGGIARKNVSVNSTLHIWKKENGLSGVKAIGGAIREAVSASRPDLQDGLHCADWHVIDARYLRDPDGETAHGIVTLKSLVGEFVS